MAIGCVHFVSSIRLVMLDAIKDVVVVVDDYKTVKR